MRLRIFVSSPGDVPDERLRAGLVIDKLAQEFRRYFTFEVIRWEHEPLIASGHFQDALDAPSESDIVILILWSRLGTPLPEKTAMREYRGIDGRAPVTGTEWEYEDALRGARERGAPDLLAFRNTSAAPIDPRDPDKSIAQLKALNAFWSRHFAERGVFLAAYDEYATLEQFAARLEESLRKLIERRIKKLPAGEIGNQTWFEAPFRGLEAYGFEHAPIYFGRDDAVSRAAEQLAGNARCGTAFLLISGASGSGKSSLAQAALLPRLMQPQRIEGAAFMRRLVFRPGSGGDPVLSLVEALTRMPPVDGIGLPELLGPGQSAAELAAHLREGPDRPGFVFSHALGRLTEMARTGGRLLAFESAKLILLIDQLEELFTTASVAAPDRRLFARLLAGLARSGSVWVIATLRADFWHRAAEIPELLELAQGAGRFDLAAPAPAELAEMIRKPAYAAGLTFETHDQSGLGLDMVIAADAVATPGHQGYAEAAPGVLPLLSFVLDALYSEDVARRGTHTLTFATYGALGGLRGAMSKRAEETIAGLPEPARAAVPRVLRTLVTVTGGSEQAVVARTVPRDRFADTPAAGAALDAFIAARLVVAARQGEAATLRLAHEALITHWERARVQFAADRRDLETRALVERQQARWEKAGGKARRQLLLRDPDLANAVDLVRRWGDELDGKTLAFIVASRRRARLLQQLVAAAAVLFALVALTASGLGVVAHRSQQRAEQARLEADRQRALAEQSLAAATDTANRLIENLARRFRETWGVPTVVVRDMLGRAQALQDQLARSAPATPALRRSQYAALIEISAALAAQGDESGALQAADGARRIMEALLDVEPDNRDWQRDFAIALQRIGDVTSRADRMPAFQLSREVLENLTRADPGNARWQHDLSAAYTGLGDLLADNGNLPGALERYEASRAILERLPRDQDDLGHDLGALYVRIGDVLKQQGKLSEALNVYQASLTAVMGGSFVLNPNDATLQRDESIAWGRIGDAWFAQKNLDRALTSYQHGLATVTYLARSDSSNLLWQRDLAIAHRNVGRTLEARGDLAEALKSYQANLAIAERLDEVDRDRYRGGTVAAVQQRHHDLAVAYSLVADVLKAQGNLVEALKSYQASLAVGERYTLHFAGEFLRTMGNVGDLQAALGNRSEALRSYERMLVELEYDAKQHPEKPQAQVELALILVKTSSVSAPGAARAALERALSIVEPLARDGKLSAEQQDMPKMIRDRLAELPQ